MTTLLFISIAGIIYCFTYLFIRELVNIPERFDLLFSILFWILCVAWFISLGCIE